MPHERPGPDTKKPGPAGPGRLDTAKCYRQRYRLGGGPMSGGMCCCDRRPLWRNAESPRTEKQLDGWRAAITHLFDLGLPPQVPVAVLDGLWRRGGFDAAVAELAHAVQSREEVAL